MNFTLTIFFVAFGLFAGMLVFLELGRRAGIRQLAKHPDDTRSGIGAVEGAVFALLGLLIAFTFSGAASRLDTRRQLIVEEANSIGTAYLRLDLLKSQIRDEIRDNFRQYVKIRLELYRDFEHPEAAMRLWLECTQLQGKIWNLVVSACKEQGSQSASMLLLPAINQMIDITSTRFMATMMHPPKTIFVMLVILAFASSLVAGYGMTSRKRSWIHIVCFALITATTIFVILDLEYPRLGLIQIQRADGLLQDLLQSMK
jgi:hypothetical protein